MGGITGALVSRGLQPAGRGDYAVLVSIAGIAIAASHLSLEQAHVYLWREHAELRRSLVANAFVLAAGLGTLAAVGGYSVVRSLGPNIVPVSSYGLLALSLLSVPASLALLYL